MRAACALLIAAAVCSSTTMAQTAYEPSPAVDRWWRTIFGFDELKSVASDDAEVQRAGAMVYLLSAPSVELIQRDEQSTLTVRYLGNKLTVPIANEAWISLAKMADQAFVVASERDLRKAARRNRNIVCHGTDVVIERTTVNGTNRLRAFSCNGKIAEPALSYVEALAETAVNAIGACKAVPKMESSIRQLTYCTDKLGWRATPEYMATAAQNSYPIEQTK